MRNTKKLLPIIFFFFLLQACAQKKEQKYPNIIVKEITPEEDSLNKKAWSFVQKNGSILVLVDTVKKTLKSTRPFEHRDTYISECTPNYFLVTMRFKLNSDIKSNIIWGRVEAKLDYKGRILSMGKIYL